MLRSRLLVTPPIQIAEKPPSTDNSTPFTKLASSEARNSATVANFLRTPHLSLRDQGFEHLPRLLVESLGIQCVDLPPGLSTFTRIFLPFSSLSHVRANEQLGSESAWEGAVFEIPVSTNTDSSGEVGHALISVGSSTAK